MGLILNGNAPNKILYNGAEVSLYFNGSKIWPDIDPYNPLNLPQNTIRVRTSDGNAPIKGSSTTYETATLVSGTTDVYDVYKSGGLANLFRDSTNLIEVLGANTTGVTTMSTMFYNCTALTAISLFDTSIVTSMNLMFSDCKVLTSIPLFDTSKVTNMDAMLYGCRALTSIPLFDTSNVTNMRDMLAVCTSLTTVPLFNTSKVTNMHNMFGYCSSLTAIPLFNTSKVTDMGGMFQNCTNVQSGALALYNQASSQTTPPSSHYRTFYRCGYSTTVGAAELAQIPSDWK